MKTQIRLLIADDHAIMRQGLTSIFRFQHDFTVVGEAVDGADAIQKVDALQPDIVIMDLMMPVIDGAEATRQITQRHPETKVIILTSFANSTDMAHAIENGAVGALTKTSSKEDLFTCIRDVARQSTAIAPEISQSLNENEDIPKLTSRQMEILTSLSRGLTNKDIAKQLGISTGCIKFHILAIFRKLGVANRSEAVALALRKRLLKD